MARTAEPIARMAAIHAAVAPWRRRTPAPRTFQATNMDPTPSWHWLTAWQAEHLARGGQPTYGARDVAIEQWGLGATSRSAAATTVAVQALETRLALESGIANALCAARAATVSL